MGVATSIDEAFVAIDLELERPICAVIGNMRIGCRNPAIATRNNAPAYKCGEIIGDSGVIQLDKSVICDGNASTDTSMEIVIFLDSGIECPIIGESRIVDLDIAFAEPDTASLILG